MDFFTGFNGKVIIYEYIVTHLPHTVSNIAPLPFQPCHYFSIRCVLVLIMYKLKQTFIAEKTKAASQ